MESLESPCDSMFSISGLSLWIASGVALAKTVGSSGIAIISSLREFNLLNSWQSKNFARFYKIAGNFLQIL